MYIKNHFFLFISFVFLQSCSTDENSPDCGCDSPSISTISKDAPVTGKITYKRQMHPDDTFYNERFWIGFNEGATKLIICNEDFLKGSFDNLKESDNQINVQFSGEIKELCNKKNDIANFVFKHLTITSIKRL